MEKADFGQGIWLTFTSDHDVDLAVQRFVALFGRPPGYAGIDRRWRVPTLKVGPVPGQEGGV